MTNNQTSPKRCAECSGKFGLTRRYSWRTSLCSRKCLDLFEARRSRHREWLLGQFYCASMGKA